MTRRKTTRADYELGSSNVYADLGHADAAAMAVKAQLVAKISEVLASRGLTQIAAATVLGISQPKLSRLLRGHFHGISERKLMDCLAQLGHDVQIVVRSAPLERSCGLVSVRIS